MDDELKAAVLAYENSPEAVHDIFDCEDDETPTAATPTCVSDWSFHAANYERAKRRDQMRALVGLPPLLKPNDFRRNFGWPKPAKASLVETPT